MKVRKVQSSFSFQTPLRYTHLRAQPSTWNFTNTNFILVEPKTEPLDHFELFPSLPSELRLKVWKFARRPRTIEVRFTLHFTHTPTSLVPHDFRAPPPFLINANHESRTETLKAYRHTLLNPHTVTSPSTIHADAFKARFNFELDTLAFRTPDPCVNLPQLELFLVFLPHREKIRYLACSPLCLVPSFWRRERDEGERVGFRYSVPRPLTFWPPALMRFPALEEIRLLEQLVHAPPTAITTAAATVTLRPEYRACTCSSSSSSSSSNARTSKLATFFDVVDGSGKALPGSEGIHGHMMLRADQFAAYVKCHWGWWKVPRFAYKGVCYKGLGKGEGFCVAVGEKMYGGAVVYAVESLR